MFQFDGLVIEPEGLEQVGDLPAFAPLPEQFRDPAGEEGQHHLGGVGLAAAAAVASLIEYRMLRHAVRSDVADVTVVGGRLRVTLAAAALGGVAGVAVRPIAAGLAPIVAGLVVVGVVGAVYLVAAWRLGVPEASARRWATPAATCGRSCPCDRRPGEGSAIVCSGRGSTRDQRMAATVRSPHETAVSPP
jgi:hypothetical protein